MELAVLLLFPRLRYVMPRLKWKTARESIVGSVVTYRSIMLVLYGMLCFCLFSICLPLKKKCCNKDFWMHTLRNIVERYYSYIEASIVVSY